ncbi:MAG: hypothetical protein SP1CHLAM54_08170 [Chlamydiia bacterium]|nr:hypothetical protein [Chlamydiia bacterium]MCH9615723.1 hypothetical protein [Chlamydiia bacterium]MCH9628874.1 hypothetical protein [Chlamydiia bacterium]
MIVYLPLLHYVEIAVIVEVIVILLAMVTAFLLHLYFSTKKRRTHKTEKYLTDLLMNIHLEQVRFDTKLFKGKGIRLHHIVKVIKSLDDKISGEHWEETKILIGRDILKDKVKKYLHSRKWIRRAQAIQAAEMIRGDLNEDMIVVGLSDPIPVVKILAVEGAVRLKTKRTINATLEAMSKEESFGRYPFRDGLLKGDVEVFQILAERLKTEDHPKLRACCLEIVSQKVGFINFELIKNDLDSEDLSLRWWAIRSLENYPTAESFEKLKEACHDAYWQIQALACRCLGLYGQAEAISLLIEKLSSEHWLVRLNAGISLKTIGQEGVAALKNMKEEDNELGFQAAQYVLALPTSALGAEAVKWFDVLPSS